MDCLMRRDEIAMLAPARSSAEMRCDAMRCGDKGDE